jgi:deoxyribodipyrimidine photolyase-related protein
LKTIFLLFPHQLFSDLEPLKKVDSVCLVEEELFFSQYKFHQQKLVLHRASMQYYASLLKKNKISVNYVEAKESVSKIQLLIDSFATKGVGELHLYRVTDNWLEKRITVAAQKNRINIQWLDTPLFLQTQAEVDHNFNNKTSFFQTTFYTTQRKKYKVLLEKDGKPVGGKWSFDADNRLAYPKGKIPPEVLMPLENEWLQEARQYVSTHFSDNPGELKGPINYAVTHAEAEKWLDDFVAHRFADFGLYEDAIVATEHILHHSVLTPYLNIGLLTPKQILDKILKAYQQQAAPLNSVEGFIRQIIGWREFIRGIYEVAGTKQRTTNYWKFTRKIPASFYEGTTGIAPVDDTIKKLLATGYSHHIERLMVLSNFMLLCEFDPDEVYRWFMELYIDAYDWVMVPNVYGMGQFADGGLMCTKPYISGSNYIFKMSDYKKGAPWAATWDALFWRFMHVHRSFFLQNPRLGMLIRTFDKMPAQKQQDLLQTAEEFLTALDSK